MFLKSLAKQLFGDISSSPIATKDMGASELKVRRVLNVGGANKEIPIPLHYKGWEHLLLDIQEGPGVDLVMDSRHLRAVTDTQFDAIYCSHNLEHYFAHDVDLVLDGFLNVLKPDGFAEIAVPDVRAVMNHMVVNSMDVDDVLYQCPSGPITVQDVIWGWGRQIESSGVDFYAHKTGFTDSYLHKKLTNAGFQEIWIMAAPSAFELRAFAFKIQASIQQKKALGLELSN